VLRPVRPEGSIATRRLTPARKASLRRRLVDWYRRERRDLPWRSNRDAYRVWISEAMLQQTRVETVVDYFERFLERFPRLEDLAAADEEEVLALWSGLGYYSRARKLRAAARALVERHDGEFPRTREAALALPGVGPYTAGAVLSIAYDLPEPLVDGNVRRVFCRLFGLDAPADSTALQKELWALAESLVPRRGGAGDWNQGLMELGATVCTPRSPRCSTCPWTRSCVARREGRTTELPRVAPRSAPTPVEARIFVAERGGSLLLERRPRDGRLAGMWQFPTVEHRRPAGAQGHLFPTELPRHRKTPVLSPGEVVGELRHSITRYSIRAEVVEASLMGEPPPSWSWFGEHELEGLALTGMARKVLRARE